MDPMGRRRVKAALRALAQDPSGRAQGLDVKRLDNGSGPPIYRLRIGDWRIAFTLAQELVVQRIFRRGEGYGWLKDME
jgi:mRNA-degrading endonuclease RelE of RelBE toxin-antitoxin system